MNRSEHSANLALQGSAPAFATFAECPRSRDWDAAHKENAQRNELARIAAQSAARVAAILARMSR